MKYTTGLITALLLALAAAPAGAMNLGELSVTSHLGEPFAAEVEVLASIAEAEQPITAAVVRDLFAHDGVDASNFEARVIREGGRIYVRVASTSAIDVASFSLRLQVSHDGYALTSRFGVALAPLAPPPVPKARPVKRSKRASVAPVARPAAIRSGEYGPVRSGETLWSIAKRAGASNMQAFMDEVFAANPEAFAGGDRNRLKLGATLRLPGAATARPAAAPEAPAPVASTAAPVSEPPAQAVETPPAAVDAAPVDPEFTAMISAFDAKLAAIRAKYGDDAAAANAEPASTATENTIPVAPPTAAASAAPAAKPAPAQAAAPVAAATPQPQVATPPAEPATPWWQSLPIVEFALGALILGVLAGAFRVARQAVNSKQREQAQRLHTTQEADRKADVARKAENRVKLESEVRNMIEKKTESPVADMTTPPGGEPDTQPLDEPITQRIGGQDRLLAIDANIAHGRYVDAERLLHQVIGESPRNVSAKLRLAEVYYITEQVSGFVDIARDLLDHHRADISNDDWQRVMRMGKIIAPDSAPFSGVRAILTAPRGN
ncbi:MAG: hypothetical protein HY749_17285 [Gammaproteobacteria bacterium]|nr:hypothetical protein [Gammaproteobacteria bacterium]MBI5616425.1 hypothetical protein [Gammaproteobacteria bacterium]